MRDGKRRLDRSLVIVLLACRVGMAAPPAEATKEYASNLTPQGDYRLVGDKHFVRDYPALEPSGNIHVVVEIPTGTQAKWEVDPVTGTLEWELEDGKPRVVSYLPYPGNYGMIPRTSLPLEWGGDGDPLDVLLLGPALPRGTVAEARPIGVLKTLDGGQQDDKVIAVLPGSTMGEVTSMEDLDRQFHGVKEILAIWFSHYKGPGEVETKGYGSVAEAGKTIRFASHAFEVQQASAVEDRRCDSATVRQGGNLYRLRGAGLRPAVR